MSLRAMTLASALAVAATPAMAQPQAPQDQKCQVLDMAGIEGEKIFVRDLVKMYDLPVIIIEKKERFAVLAPPLNPASVDNAMVLRLNIAMADFDNMAKEGAAIVEKENCPLSNTLKTHIGVTVVLATLEARMARIILQDPGRFDSEIVNAYRAKYQDAMNPPPLPIPGLTT